MTRSEKAKMSEIVFLLRKNWKQYEEGAKNLPEVSENRGQIGYLKGHSDAYRGVLDRLIQDGLGE
ncbi:MAG: hypothetical protein QG670_2874 [Thermoproteota archaeon]|nr:hypothetical protein [Thermoproteota archaeon]